MSATIFSLFLNGVIIVLLGATIFYSTRLSMHLRAFRENRKDLDKLISELGQQIDKANQAIAGMKQAARDSGKSLQDKIDDARSLSDELQLMSDSADRLAGRMEKAGTVSQKAQRPDESKKKRVSKEQAKQAAREAVKMPAPERLPERLPDRVAERGYEKSGSPNFSIRDPEFGRDDMDQGMDEAALTGGEGGLQSRAERELYEALRKRGHNGPGGGSR